MHCYQYLEEATEWCIDSTHKTCKSFVSPTKNAYLFSVVVRSPATNKGVPVCFFITDHEIIPTIEEWLMWLKSTFSLNVKSIMVDCSAAEIAAIKNVFGDQVSIDLCDWNIKRAWEAHIKKDVSNCFR